MPAQTPLPHPLTPRLPQLLCDLLHTNLKHTLNVPRQLRVIPISRHVSPQNPASPSSAIPKERDMARRVSARRPIDTRLLTQTAGKIRSKLVVLEDRINLSLAQVAKSVPRQDSVLKVRALISTIIVFLELSSALSSHPCVLERERVESVERQAAHS